MNVASIGEAIQGVREILQLDGANLIVNSAEEDRVDITLDLEGVECLDCVMPRAAIESILLTHVKLFRCWLGIRWPMAISRVSSCA